MKFLFVRHLHEKFELNQSSLISLFSSDIISHIIIYDLVQG